jgi:hypothetical protein
MYRFYVNDPVRFRKSIRMTIEHGHANNIANDYSSTAFWYQADPHKPFRALLPAAERHPAWGDDPHDAAYRALMALRVKAFVLLVQAIRDGQELPDDLVQLMKYDISQTYFRREYDALQEQIALLDARLAQLVDGSPPDRTTD